MLGVTRGIHVELIHASSLRESAGGTVYGTVRVPVRVLVHVLWSGSKPEGNKGTERRG